MQIRRRRASRGPLVVLLLVGIVLAVMGARSLLEAQQRESSPAPVPSATVAQGVPTAEKPTAATAVSPSPQSPAPTTNPTKPEDVAQQFLALWGKADYDAMYDLLATQAKRGLTKEAFAQRHRAIAAEATILRVELSLGTVAGLPPGQGQIVIPFVANYETARIGRVEERRTLTMLSEEGRWRVLWTPGVMFEQLTDNTFVRMAPEDPVRGGIYDRTGQPLAIQGAQLAIGLQPGRIEDEQQFLSAVSAFLNWTPERLKATYVNAEPEWWVPLVELPMTRRAEVTEKIGHIPGVMFRETPARVYPQGTVAAHVVGYLGHPTAADADELRARGIRDDDWVGRAGVEGAMEDVVAGERGGRLFVVDGKESPLRRIAERPAKSGADVHLSLDLRAQRLAEEVLGERKGSIVLMDPRDNSVLALASWPRFDPNKFFTGFSAEEWETLSNDPNQPFLNRAALGAYPTGSVFKVITMAAGLERGDFKPDTSFECRGSWTGYGPTQVFHDWLPQGHGRLTLFDGLSQSCNIVFYEISKALNDANPNLLPEYARAFGLGEPTGMRGLEDSRGNVPDPSWKRRSTGQDWFGGDAANLAIGQGFLTATPLQMANIYSALALDGVLRTPLLVRRVAPKDGGTPETFVAQERRRLPMSPATLQTIKEAMVQTAANPKGTAHYAFRGSSIPVAAKTGSAEFQGERPTTARQALDSHAWFAGFAPADHPELVVIVMVEGGGGGSQTAAPIARQIIDRYFQPTQPGQR